MATPFISILIAARNEEANIVSCLQAISKLEYPIDRFEVWVGDDQSTDRTKELVTEFVQDHPNFYLHTIEENLGKAKGKANVLAHLAHKAKGEVFCITDADVIVPTSWLKGLVTHWDENVGMITGITLVSGKS